MERRRFLAGLSVLGTAAALPSCRRADECTTTSGPDPHGHAAIMAAGHGEPGEPDGADDRFAALAGFLCGRFADRRG